MKTIEVYLISELKPKVQAQVLNKHRYDWADDRYYVETVRECINETLKDKGIELDWHIENDELCWNADSDFIIAHYDLSIIEQIQRDFKALLSDEFDYVTSDEHLLDIFDCNDYHFTAEGLMV